MARYNEFNVIIKGLNSEFIIECFTYRYIRIASYQLYNILRRYVYLVCCYSCYSLNKLK